MKHLSLIFKITTYGSKLLNLIKHRSQASYDLPAEEVPAEQGLSTATASAKMLSTPGPSTVSSKYKHYYLPGKDL